MILKEVVSYDEQWGKIMTVTTPLTPQGTWTALVLAGNRPKGDALAAQFGVVAKALIDFAGSPMLSRVVAALHETPEIGRVVVMAQDTALLEEAVALGGGATLVTSGAGISNSIANAVGTDLPFPILVTTADHPLLEPATISAFLNGAGDADVAVGMVEKAVLASRYPENRRTWLKFSDGHWSGANLFALRTAKCLPALELWARAEQDRKTVWKLFLHFGPWLAFRALTRTIGLCDALARAGKRLDLKAKLVALDAAEAAIDVDKPDDYDQALEIWQHRIRSDKL